MTKRNTWEAQLLEKIDPAHITVVEDMGYRAARMRLDIRRDELAQSKPLTKLLVIPGRVRQEFRRYMTLHGFKGEVGRYLRRRFENKFKEMVEASLSSTTPRA